MTNKVLLSDSKRRLLERMLRGEFARSVGEEAIEPCEPGAPVPLAPSQRQIWLHSQMAPDVPVYNEPITICRRGPLDREVLERTFHEILRRHAIWRTTFAALDDQVVQIVHENCGIPIPYSDLCSLPESERETAATRMATEDAQLPFDLNAGPLVRPLLVKLGHDHYRFHLTLHHLIFDGMTVYHVLLPELAAIYDAFSNEKPSPLPEPRLQYADYALWQNRRWEKESATGQLDYWRQTLAGGQAPSPYLPEDRPRPAAPTFRGGTETFAFPAGLIEDVRRAAAEEGVTPYMLLLASFHALLHRYSGQEDLMVGGVTDGRRRAEFETLMGSFTNIVVLRTRPQGEMLFREFLGQVKEVVLGAVANGDVPFDSVVRELHAKRDASRNPFYQVLFSIGPPPVKSQRSGWELEQLGIDTGASKCDLYFALDECWNGMTGRLHYSSDLFDQATLRRMTGHWLTLLESVVRDRGTKLRDLKLMSPAETRELVHDEDKTACAIPDLTMHELIERQAALSPDAVAVEAAGVCLTYRELNERANRLARRLQRSGVAPDTLVAVCVDRTVDLVIAPLAVLKAGAAYLPLDPGFPKERLAYLIEDARALVVLTTRPLERQLPLAGARLVYCEDSEGDGSNLTSAATPQSLAYVRYTSGSTGRPNGVEISHRALINLLLSMQREPGLTKADSLLAVTTHSFDISDLELHLPLITGARLVIAPRDAALDGTALARMLRDAAITIMQATPVTWRLLLESGWQGTPGLKVLCGGEALPRDLAESLLATGAEVWNLYGPTETTIWSTVQRVDSRPGRVSIGHPIANTQVYVMDEFGQPVPAGVVGELYIGGDGLARGYLRRPELTAARFVDHPFHPGRRLYRTGDLARRLPDGSLECIARVDHQVKLRGFRIELGEIEYALEQQPGISQAVVVIREETAGEQELTAYVTVQDRAAADPGLLRKALLSHLPEYMVPAAYVHLDEFPLTPNRKVDRKALLALEHRPRRPGRLIEFAGGGVDRCAVASSEQGESTNGYAPPSNHVEFVMTQIWSEVLNVDKVGVFDNFFELGGHSLAATRLIARLRSALGMDLPLRCIFIDPTIASLSRHIFYDAGAQSYRYTSEIPQWNCLVPAQPKGTRTPLFFVAGYQSPDDTLLVLSRLIPHLGTDQPVFGFRPRWIEGTGDAYASAQEVAREFLTELRAVQPKGPYLLAGHCVGGIAALEIAQLLLQEGEEVKLLVLLDTERPTAVRTLLTDFYFMRRRVGHIADEVSGILRSNKDARRDIVRDIIRRKFGAAPSTQAREADRFNDLKTRYRRLLYSHIPKKYPGRITLIVNEKQAQFDRHLGWGGAAPGGLDIHTMPGDHDTILTQHGKEVAQLILKSIDDALAEPGSKAAGRYHGVSCDPKVTGVHYNEVHG